MPVRRRIVGKTRPPPAKHRVTGNTTAAFTDYAHLPAPAAAPVPEAKKPPQRKVTKVCKITVERPGEPTQVYHTKSSNEVLP